MIQSVQINNFRCLRDVYAPLAPLTVIVGENDTGKSAFLDAIAVPFETGAQFQIANTDHWLRNLAHKVTVRVATFAGGMVEVQPVPTQPGHYNRPHHPGMTVGLFRVSAAGPAMQSPGARESEGVPQLSQTAERLPALLDYLLRTDKRRLIQMEQAARARVPGLLEINLPAPEEATRRIELLLDSGLRLPAASASAGVRLIIFYLALTYHPDPPSVIMIEEPENAVHPKRLADIMKLLRGITKGEHCGHPAQVILTTHSPYLLDHVNLDEDQVLVFRRNDDGSRTCEPVDRERLKSFLDDFMLGEVWFNQGEEGLVKKG